MITFRRLLWLQLIIVLQLCIRVLIGSEILQWTRSIMPCHFVGDAT